MGAISIGTKARWSAFGMIRSHLSSEINRLSDFPMSALKTRPNSFEQFVIRNFSWLLSVPARFRRISNLLFCYVIYCNLKG